MVMSAQACDDHIITDHVILRSTSCNVKLKALRALLCLGAVR
jgi:hypothetical protein